MSASELLKVVDLDVRYRGRRRRPDVHAVRGASFSIEPATTFGLVGESGSGKSTLARALIRLVAPSAGTIELDGINVNELRTRDLRQVRRRMPMVFQDPFSAVNPSLTIEAIIQEGIGAGPRETRTDRVGELLEMVDLPGDFRGRRPSELSGGQLQRVTLARALACEPDLVILDEPLSALDVSSQVQIVALLRELQAELGLTYLLISHDLAVVRLLAHRIAVMNAGEIVEMADTESLFCRPHHPYTRRLLDSMPIPHPDLRRHHTRRTNDEPLDPSVDVVGCRYQRRCEFAVDECTTTAPGLNRRETDRLVRCHLELGPTAGSTQHAPSMDIEQGAEASKAGADRDV